MAKYTQGKPTAQQLSKAFFERMRDNAPEIYEALKDLYGLRNRPYNYSVDKTLDILERVEAVLASIDGGK